MRADQHRQALGFLTVAETGALADQGVRILDPSSTLISPRAVIGRGTLLYPTVVVGADDESLVTIGADCVLYPGTLIEASAGGQIAVADACELGPGGAVLRVSEPSSRIALEQEVRLTGGCELTGDCELGRGAQILGAISARSVRLGGGQGGHRWPDPDQRGAVLKGTGIANATSLRPGQVISCRSSFADARVELQSGYHPPGG